MSDKAYQVVVEEESACEFWSNLDADCNNLGHVFSLWASVVCSVMRNELGDGENGFLLSFFFFLSLTKMGILTLVGSKKKASFFQGGEHSFWIFCPIGTASDLWLWFFPYRWLGLKRTRPLHTT